MVYFLLYIYNVLMYENNKYMYDTSILFPIIIIFLYRLYKTIPIFI